MKPFNLDYFMVATVALLTFAIGMALHPKSQLCLWRPVPSVLSLMNVGAGCSYNGLSRRGGDLACRALVFVCLSAGKVALSHSPSASEINSCADASPTGSLGANSSRCTA